MHRSTDNPWRRSVTWAGVFFALQLPLIAQTGSRALNRAGLPHVPFIGCRSDGQVGPAPAPIGTDKAVQIAGTAVQNLAFYASENTRGVLAPRGWHCFGVYGSSGSALFVSPQPIDEHLGRSANWQSFAGPVIEVDDISGGTSGRFLVAQVIARVFPAQKAFVQGVIEEGIEPASDFPFGPFPSDRLVYKSNDVVEFVTPANSDGLGTMTRLKKNREPIEGVAILLGPETDLVQLTVRLPEGLKPLATDIIHQFESEEAGRPAR